MKQQGRAGRNGGRKQVSWTPCAAAAETETAVAAIEPAVAAIEAGYDSGDGSSFAGSSIAGDHISSVGEIPTETLPQLRLCDSNALRPRLE